MTESPFGPTFLLLQQEGHLIHSCTTVGLTALRQAHIGDKGRYYTAFFQLSIGLERTLKVIIILNHMAEHALHPPSPGTLKEYGHKLLQLFEAVREVPTSKAPHPLSQVHPGTIEYDILEHLSGFANGARYFNLDTLSSPQGPADPLAQWGRILRRILEDDVPPRERSRTSHESLSVVRHRLAPTPRDEAGALSRPTDYGSKLLG